MAYVLLTCAILIVMLTGWTERRGYIRTGLFRSDWVDMAIGAGTGIVLLLLILSLIL